MWQRYTENARRAVYWAQECAKMFGQNEVEPEHLLLALFEERHTAAW